jgi:hypothetical protein
MLWQRLSTGEIPQTLSRRSNTYAYIITAGMLCYSLVCLRYCFELLMSTGCITWISSENFCSNYVRISTYIVMNVRNVIAKCPYLCFCNLFCGHCETILLCNQILKSVFFVIWYLNEWTESVLLSRSTRGYQRIWCQMGKWLWTMTRKGNRTGYGLFWRHYNT